MISGIFNLANYTPFNVSIWFLMAFQAGAINAGGFLSCHRFVSHTTGFATHFGAEFAQGKVYQAIGIASVPIFFLLGTMLSAYFVDKRIAQQKKPQYSVLVWTMTLLMLVVVVAGNRGWFGTFGDSMNIEPDYPLLAILTLACGIQNAMITSASGSAIRTTHLTGITTDLGIGLMRILSGKKDDKLLLMERKATFMRFGIILFFIVGSTFASFAFLAFGYFGFLLPAATSGVLILYDFFQRRITLRASHG
jgi:uncharacterized membrane protein YoaK (UPF0700 family)